MTSADFVAGQSLPACDIDDDDEQIEDFINIIIHAHDSHQPYISEHFQQVSVIDPILFTPPPSLIRHLRKSIIIISSVCWSVTPRPRNNSQLLNDETVLQIS